MWMGRGACLVGLWLAVIAASHAQISFDGFQTLYDGHCAVCHGERLQGGAQGVSLVGGELAHGSSVREIAASIAEGYPGSGMPAWRHVLDEGQIQSLAIFVSEQRSGYDYREFHIESELRLPEGVIEGESHAFRLETVIAGLDPLPYSIAPLPDGSLLLTEKMRGLSLVSAGGVQSDLIPGAPVGYNDDEPLAGTGLRLGVGWVMDVALHPDYHRNGWVYVLYSDRCEDCNAMSRATGKPVSMNRLVRGHLRDGAWTDEQVIWQADIETYSPMTDHTAGGRITFDPDGYVFMSLGMKGPNNYVGIQDLSLPYGKIHRVHDDGRMPADNPFVGVPGALASTWTYGHRSPQGLEYDPATGDLWGTEMGPRGGDEVNRLLPGRNYGWPLYSKGVNYDGTPVAYGGLLGIEVDPADIEQPVVDLTPSPAVSSLTVYAGDAFPGWRGNLIVGTLKGADLRRMVVADHKVIHVETLLRDLARVRDVESGPGGELYLLLEHAAGGRIVRLVPVRT